jgi:carbonic anhydrase/acetyltransferase-like protein (isoleucine patch superfamily)
MCVMGVPGKIVRPVKSEEQEYMRWLRSHYLELAGRYVNGEFDWREDGAAPSGK